MSDSTGNYQIVMNAGNALSILSGSNSNTITNGSSTINIGRVPMVGNNSLIVYPTFSSGLQHSMDGSGVGTITAIGRQASETRPLDFNTNMDLAKQQPVPDAMPQNVNIMLMQVNNGQNWFQNIVGVQPNIGPLIQSPPQKLQKTTNVVDPTGRQMIPNTVQPNSFQPGAIASPLALIAQPIYTPMVSIPIPYGMIPNYAPSGSLWLQSSTPDYQNVTIPPASQSIYNNNIVQPLVPIVPMPFPISSQQSDQVPLAQSSPQYSTTILDLNDDCLGAICQNLNEYELYALRDAHSRFDRATKLCYSKMDSENSLEFDFECWSEDNGVKDLGKILEYFGNCMTRVHVSLYFIKFIIKNGISQSFLSDRLKNVRFLRLDYPADRHDQIKFICALKQIQTCQITCGRNIPLRARWPNLIELNVNAYVDYITHYDVRFVVELFCFLSVHKYVQKLSIKIMDADVELRMFDCTEMTQLFNLITTGMHELTELDVAAFCANSEFMNSTEMPKLRKLRISSFDSYCIRLWRWLSLKKLKSLTVVKAIDFYTLITIVRRIRTLNHLEICFPRLDELSGENLEKLIYSRPKHRSCREREILYIYISGGHDGNKAEFCLPSHLVEYEEPIKFALWQPEYSPGLKK